MKRVLRKLTAFMIAIAAVITLVGTSVPTEAATTKPTGITLKTTASTVDIKGKVTVSVKSVKPSGASTDVTFKSSNTKIATVSAKGVVTGKKAGKVTITVTSKSAKKVKKTIKITVKNIKPTSISLNETKLSLDVDASAKLSATVKPTGVYCPVSWSSSDTTVATVSSTGKVTAKSAGTAKITAKTKEKNSKGKYLTKTCTVTVTDDIPEAVDTTQVFVSAKWVKSALAGQQSGYEDVFLSEVAYGTTENDTAYNTAHIPGAVHINSDAVEFDDWDQDGIDDFQLYEKTEVSEDDNFNIRSADQLSVFLKNNGITKDTKVILYGKKATDSSVTRVAFAMLYAGVEDVKVVDGGMQAWTDAGYPTETKANIETPGDSTYSFGTTVPAHPEYIISIDDVVSKLSSDSNFRLVSIRSEDEFVGKITGYSYIPNAGEPLGAVWGKDTDDGTYAVNNSMIDIDAVNAILAESNSSTSNELAFYCGTGWRATIPFLICYQAGVKNITLYDGGWYQWEYRNRTVSAEKYQVQKITPAEAAAKYK
jgi:thiosulfate/3-mercaptopyruvate sulfurtransferase